MFMLCDSVAADHAKILDKSMFMGNQTQVFKEIDVRVRYCAFFFLCTIQLYNCFIYNYIKSLHVFNVNRLLWIVYYGSSCSNNNCSAARYLNVNIFQHLNKINIKIIKVIDNICVEILSTFCESIYCINLFIYIEKNASKINAEFK